MGKEDKKFEPKKSVDWYDPRQLVRSGIKALIATIFGDFNDKRELQAALHHHDKKKHFDTFSNEEEIWIDYISDSGDGFNATFTMAKLLANPELDLGGIKTKRGQILIMGGDQVYPTASREEYDNRLKGPYEAAFPCKENDKTAPHVFAIPGNHDWYDGLTSFLKIFGQKRSIGNWQTQQARSYFALKLPHKVWLFGIDVQLNSDIDFNQLEYFKDIMKDEMEPESKVILCTTEPSWVYHTSRKHEAYNNLKFFETKIEESTKCIQVLTLAGDLHHYARYEAADGSQKIIAGGGGAFMHPTQNLPTKISDLKEGEIHLQKTFPSAKASKKMLFRNFWFAFSSWKLSVLFGGIYALYSAILYLYFRADLKGLSIKNILHESAMNPMIFVILLILIFGLVGFSDTKPYNPRFKKSFPYLLFGFIHGVFQSLLLILCFWKVIALVPLMFPQSPFLCWFAIQITMFVLGGLIGGSVFGIYLIKANLFLRNHDNEAYSSLRWAGYKNFIRLHITKNTLTIYPVGVKTVPKWRSKEEKFPKTFFSKSEINFEPIENPITINLSKS